MSNLENLNLDKIMTQFEQSVFVAYEKFKQNKDMSFEEFKQCFKKLEDEIIKQENNQQNIKKVITDIFNSI